MGRWYLQNTWEAAQPSLFVAWERKRCVFDRLLDDIADGWLTLIPESAALEVAFAWVLERCLSQVPAVFIRTNDALHIAAAKVAGETEFVSADKYQRVAAAFLGFTVLPFPKSSL